MRKAYLGALIKAPVTTAGLVMMCVMLAACATGTSVRPPLQAPEPVGARADDAADSTGDIGIAEDAAGDQAYVVKGSGVFLDRGAARIPAVEESPQGEITLNFVQADIAEVVQAVFGEVLNVNYVVDPAIGGTVTIQTSRPMQRESVIPTMEAVLALNGAAIVRDNGLYKIIPLEKAPRNAARPHIGRIGGSARQGYDVQIAPLAYVGGAEMQRLLEPFIGAETIVHVDANRNLLLIAGPGRAVDRLADTIEIFDVNWLAGMSFALIPLQSAEASAIVTDLESIFGDQAEGPLAGLVQFVPVEHLNAVLIISKQPAYMSEAREWVERFDAGFGDGERRTFVYNVQNGRAADIAYVLNNIYNDQSYVGGPSLAPGMTPVELSSEEGRGDTGQARPSRQAGNVYGAGGIRFIADEYNNALVVLATAREFRQIEAILKKLDVVPRQVLIEATIAEVTLNDDLRYGVQWFFKTDTGDNQFTLSEVETGAAAQEFPGFSYLLSPNADVRVVLNALDEVTDLNVISSPQLMVLNNQSANLMVGDEVPISTRESQTVIDPDAPIVNSIEFRNTGVILNVTPRVNAGGLVILDVVQEVSDVVQTTTSTLNSPTIRQRRLESSVAVQSGETIALGGLIRESQTISSSGVPGISRVPIIGGLFGRKMEDRVRTELLVLITPRVVNNSEEARKVTEELRGRLRALAPLQESVGAP